MVNEFIPSNIPLHERTVGKILTRRAEELGDKTFMETVTGETLSYQELHERSNRFAMGLPRSG